MAIQISGCTVIDNSRNITNANNMCVGVVTMTGSSGNIETPGTVTVGGFDVPGIISNIAPSNGATGAAVNTNITLSFHFTPPVRGTGTIELRRDTVGGTIIESFNAASSDRISVAGNDWILDPTSNISDTGPITIFLVIPNTAINGYVGLNTAGADTHSFATIAPPSLTASYEGGFLICKASPLRWVVSPYSAEVSRTWHLRNDANTRAQQVSGCTGWFVPTRPQLQNPGYSCKFFWGPSPCISNKYWSSTEFNASYACYFRMHVGDASSSGKTNTCCVRAFRCVTY